MTVQWSQEPWMVFRAMCHPSFDACPCLHRLALIGAEESYGKPTRKVFPSHRMMLLNDKIFYWTILRCLYSDVNT